MSNAICWRGWQLAITGLWHTELLLVWAGGLSQACQCPLASLKTQQQPNGFADFCRAQRRHGTTSTHKDSFFCRRDRDPVLLPSKNWVGIGKEREKGQEGVSSNCPLALLQKIARKFIAVEQLANQSLILCSVEWKLGAQRQMRKIASAFFRSFSFCTQDRALHTSLARGARTLKPARALKSCAVLFNWTPKLQRELWIASSWFMPF